MFGDLESLLPQFYPLQSPLEFLDSYVWGCARGIQLNIRSRHDLSALHAGDGYRTGLEDDLQADIRALLSILECYAHSQICTVCVPLLNLGAPDPGGAAGKPLVGGQTCEYAVLKKSLLGIPDPAFARASLRSHQATCKVCKAKEQRSRAGSPVWTMEAARLHRTL